MNGYKMQTTYLLVVFAIVVQHTFTKDWPDFIQKCKLSDPKFDDCVLSSANNFLSTVLKGSEKYGIPPVALSSNSTSEYKLSENFTMKFMNLSANLYENFEFKYIYFNFEKKMLIFGMKTGQSMYSGEYEAAGEILGKPAHQSGKVNVTFNYIEFNAVVTLDFTMKDENKYLEAVSCILFVNFNNFQFKPFDQMIIGEPMTVEQDHVFESYIAKLPQLMKKDNEKYDKTIVEALNKIFTIVPFVNLFIP